MIQCEDASRLHPRVAVDLHGEKLFGSNLWGRVKARRETGQVNDFDFASLTKTGSLLWCFGCCVAKLVKYENNQQMSKKSNS